MCYCALLWWCVIAAIGFPGVHVMLSFMLLQFSKIDIGERVIQWYVPLVTTSRLT